MARGNAIVVEANPRGVFREGFVKTGQTFYPGMIVQRDPTVALKGGRATYKIYDRDADGDRPAGAFWVVTELLRSMLGETASTPIAAGDRVMLYSPLAGEELNLLFKNVAGTADDVIAGDILTVDDGTGKVQVTSSTPETEIAMALEALTDPTADTLLWSEWSGH